jgi:hypothetical protein
MNNMICSYPDREAVLVAYLYDDIDAAGRVAFEAHVTTCLPCRGEAAELRGVRVTLGQWAPPEPARAFSHQSSVISHQSPVSGAWWHTVPVWAQVAAALLVLGVSASIANLDVRYDSNGLNVRTGWSRPAPPPAPVDAAPWRSELTALQNQLQSEMRAQAASVAVAPAAPAAPVNVAMSDAELGQRVRVLIDESEKKQEQSLALHLVQLQRDFEAQRQADLRRSNQLFRQVTSTYGDEIAKHEQQIKYLLPASQK